MRRDYTNRIRWVLDELVPPLLRDNKWFMYPLFWMAYRGNNVNFYMHFKDHVADLTDEEFARAYAEMDSIGSNRPTDMNEASMTYALELIGPDHRTLLDAGCGRGYWIERLARTTDLELTGVDLIDDVVLGDGVRYERASLHQLPFEDDAFDVVFASHTLEHVVHLDVALAELVRVAKQRVVFVVPKQRYYRYTLDMHLHFFPHEAQLRASFGHPIVGLRDCDGDWVGAIDPV